MMCWLIRYDDSEDGEAEREVREAFHRAFLDGLVEDLKRKPPSYERCLRLLEEIKTAIFETTGESMDNYVCVYL